MDEVVRGIIDTAVNAADDEVLDFGGVFDGVAESEGGAPRVAVEVEGFDFEVVGDFGDVGDEVLGGVVLEITVRGRLAAAALIEKDDTVLSGVERLFVTVFDGAAGTTVEKDEGGLGFRVTPVHDVELMPVADVEHEILISVSVIRHNCSPFWTIITYGRVVAVAPRFNGF